MHTTGQLCKLPTHEVNHIFSLFGYSTHLYIAINTAIVSELVLPISGAKVLKVEVTCTKQL